MINSLIQSLKGKTNKGRLSKKELDGILKDKKLPIITLDGNWYNVKQALNNKTIEEQEKFLIEYMKQQGKLTNNLGDFKTKKSALLQKILVLSEEVNQSVEEQKVNALTIAKQEVEKINKALEETEKKLEEVEQSIEQINKSIFIEVTNEGYNFMATHKGIIKELDKEIDELRHKMLEKIKERKMYEGEYKLYYQYLHDTVGYKNIEELDYRIGENNE